MESVPNLLTITRIIIIPIIISTFYFDDIVFAHRLGAALFFFASVTDFFDGYLARKFKCQSTFGEMFDPIADKILIASILLMLVKFRKIQVFPCLLILAREFFVTGMREFLSQISISIPVSKLAKIKTTMQMIAIFTLLLGSKGTGVASLDLLGKVMLWIAAILTIVTGYSYFKAYYNTLGKRSD